VIFSTADVCYFMFYVTATTMICWFIQPSPNFSLLCLYQFGARYVLMNGYHIIVLNISESCYPLCYYFSSPCSVKYYEQDIKMGELCESQ